MVTKNELLRELYLIQHRDSDPDARLLAYSQFLATQSLPQQQVIDLLLGVSTF
jgi:hypothetical protein